MSLLYDYIEECKNSEKIMLYNIFNIYINLKVNI